MDFLNSVLDNLEEALVITDPTSRILLFNKVAESINVQAQLPQLRIDSFVFELIGEQGRKVVVPIFERLKTEKHPILSFAEFKTVTDEILYLEFKYIPVVNEVGEVTHVVIFFRDITPQKVFERKLLTQASNISNIIDKANAIVMGFDTRGYITDWNLHSEKVTGYKKTQVFAQKFSDLFIEKDNRELFDELLINILSRQPIINYEMQVLTKSKATRTLLLSSSLRLSEAGTVVGVVFVGQDVTELMDYRSSLEKQVDERTYELKMALAKEKEIVDMKSRFVSVASHEFRTPLSTIENAAHFIKVNNHRIKPEQLERKLETIEKLIKHMTHLLDDVLTYGKSEAGKVKLMLTEVAVSKFVNQIVEEVGHSTKNTHVIKLILEDVSEQIITDEKLLRNVIINLLTNAIKFSPGKKHITMEVRCDNKRLFIKISDYGIGIPEDEIDKIFEPFERGKSVSSIQGTGLGLSIVKKAIELLSGTIKIQSVVGSGTTFIVTIPIQANEK